MCESGTEHRLVRARIADGEWGLNDVTQVRIDLASELPVEPYAARGQSVPFW